MWNYVGMMMTFKMAMTKPLGDYSVNFFPSTTSLCYSRLTQILSSFFLTQVINKPTYYNTNGTSSQIDLVLMSTPKVLAECTTVSPF